MLLFRGDSLAEGLIEQQTSRIMKIGMKLVASRMFKTYPYEENFFLEQSRRIREKVQCGVCYIGGVCSNESIRTLMSDGFDFIQLGRGLLFDPDFPKNAQAKADYVNGCSHCNQCATLIDAEGGILGVEREENFV